MIVRFLKSKRRTHLRPAPMGPLVVIGDIHGRLDLLDKLLAQIETDPDLGCGYDLVVAGDMVDRGPESLGVIDRVMSLSQVRPIPVITLMGNHERMMLDFIEGGDSGFTWLRVGGRETLASLGLPLADQALSEPDTLRAEIRDALGPDRIAWLSALPLLYRTGNVICVHAAYDAQQPEDRQDPKTLLWGSSEFYRRKHLEPPWIIHGHVVTRPPAVVGVRIAVDSGAWLGGGLTAAVVLPDTEARFITVDI